MSDPPSGPGIQSDWPAATGSRADVRDAFWTLLGAIPAFAPTVASGFWGSWEAGVVREG